MVRPSFLPPFASDAAIYSVCTPHSHLLSGPCRSGILSRRSILKPTSFPAKIMHLLSLCTTRFQMSSVKLLTGLLYAFSYFLQSSRSLFGRLEKASFTGKRPQKKTAPRICLLQQIHGAIIYRGYQFKEISTVMMQASIQTPSGIQMMYHDTAYHDAGHSYEEIL